MFLCKVLGGKIRDVGWGSPQPTHQVRALPSIAPQCCHYSGLGAEFSHWRNHIQVVSLFCNDHLECPGGGFLNPPVVVIEHRQQRRLVRGDGSDIKTRQRSGCVESHPERLIGILEHVLHLLDCRRGYITQSKGTPLEHTRNR